MTILAGGKSKGGNWREGNGRHEEEAIGWAGGPGGAGRQTDAERNFCIERQVKGDKLTSPWNSLVVLAGGAGKVWRKK